MIQSMTGFGVAENSSFKVEIRSVNHRFIDISVKVPPTMNHYDIPLRNAIKERFQRGKFDVFISVSNHGDAGVHFNKERAKDIYNTLQILKKELSIPGEITIDTLVDYRELFIEKESKDDFDTLYSVFNEAVADLEAMRKREGELIAKVLRSRIQQVDKLNNEIKSIAPKEIMRLKEKLNDRLREIIKDEVFDSSRILQEAAIIAEKSDISEEVNLIENHIRQFLFILDSGATVGRKLDFLLQEMNREVNTLAYKSTDYNVSAIVVDMKTELEKIREQVQNIQ